MGTLAPPSVARLSVGRPSVREASLPPPYIGPKERAMCGEGNMCWQRTCPDQRVVCKVMTKMCFTDLNLELSFRQWIVFDVSVIIAICVDFFKVNFINGCILRYFVKIKPFELIVKRRDNISRVNRSIVEIYLANVSYKGECPIYLVHCCYIE